MTHFRIHQKLVALCVFWAFMLLAGCSRSPADSMTHVLTECADIAKDARAHARDEAALAGYIADHFQAVDTSGCPPEFRAAFQAHVNAWRQAQYAYANNTVANNFVEGAVAGFTGDYSGVGQTLGTAYQAGQDINNTYYRLTVFAAASGARIPR